MELHDHGSRGNGARQTRLLVPLSELVETIDSPWQLVDFIDALRRDLIDRPNDWENATLDRYQAALAAWTTDAEEQVASGGTASGGDPTWRLMGQMLLAARIYE
jgi:hypothetical protein